VSGTVAASVNNDSARSALAGQNDWLALRYKAGSVGGFSLSALQPDRTPQEETITTDQLQSIAQVVNGDAKRPKIKIKRRRRAGKIRVVVTATDNKAIDHLDVTIGKKHKTVVAKRSKTVTKLVFKTKVKPGKRILAVAFDRAGNQRGRKLRAR